MKRFTARDRMTISRRRVTDDGFLVAPAVLGRTGIQLYLASELGLDAEMRMAPSQIVRLYRPPDEVFAPDSLASFEGAPITVEHPTVPVTADNWRDLAVGDAHKITRDGETMAGEVIVRDQQAIKIIDAGKVELSNGYTFTLDMRAGTTPDGQPFDGVQRNIRGNHVAIVDVARCGSTCRISDSQPNHQGNNMAQRKVAVDGIQVEAEDSAASAIEKLIKERDTARASLAALETASAAPISVGDCGMLPLAGLVALAQDQAKRLKELEGKVLTDAQIEARVTARAALITDAKALHEKVATDGRTDSDIQRDVLTHLVAADAAFKPVLDAALDGVAVADASPDKLRVAFAIAKARPAVKADDAAQREQTGRAILGGDAQQAGQQGKAQGADAEPIGRSAALARLSQPQSA